MATHPETMEFILEKLADRKTFTSRSMFGEYALYANGKPVGFVCDDLFYVKILPASAELEDLCEKGHAYPGSKLYYIVEESQLSSLEDLPQLLIDMASTIPAKKKKAKKTGAKRSTK